MWLYLFRRSDVGTMRHWEHVSRRDTVVDMVTSGLWKNDALGRRCQALWPVSQIAFHVFIPMVHFSLHICFLSSPHSPLVLRNISFFPSTHILIRLDGCNEMRGEGLAGSAPMSRTWAGSRMSGTQRPKLYRYTLPMSLLCWTGICSLYCRNMSGYYSVSMGK